MKTENLPDGWNKEKIKYLVSINTNHAENNDNYIGMENIESWTGKFVESDGFVAEGETLEVNEGDVIFGKLRPYLAKVYIAEKKACCSTEFLVMQPNEKISSKFLQYSLLNRKTIDDIDRSTYGTKMPRANWDFIGNYKIPVPPFSSQLSIINFLDSKCTEIQAAIDNTKLTIEEYKKLKQAVITKAVTKGLEPNRKMKDSDIEWIGEIPEAWETANPKSLFSLRKQKATKGERQLSASQKHGIVYQDEYMEMTGARVVTVMKDFDILKHVEAGDFVIHMRSFQGGIEYSEKSGSISSAYVMLIPNLEYVYPRYYKWLLKSENYIRALNGTTDLVRDGQAMRYSNFAQVRLVRVPIAEQKSIAEYLDCKCSQIDMIISQKEQFITELEKYKQSLIYEYVTGKKQL